MKINLVTTAFVFPGQGSQAVGMGKELAEQFPIAKQVFDEADAILGFSLSKIIWDGPKDELDETINTQPALYVHSYAAWMTFTDQASAKPATVAGHSLGELSALTASGALSFADGLKLVRTRGELMKRAGELNPGGMAAILGVDIPTLDKVCADASTADEIVQVANDNCPGQVVISGHKPALERAMAGAKAAGAKRALPLAVSIAAHSPLMDSIQNDWNAAVDACAIIDAEIPVVGNVHAKVMRTADELRADIKAQMQSRVRWTESVQVM
ncbi:MAG: ACP S-malonyltransferase, partial [Chloroflexota bacterium]